VIHTEDRQVTFQLEARDARELICRGLHKRAVINMEKFSRRVREKTT
jgi:predicted thioesterase